MYFTLTCTISINTNLNNLLQYGYTSEAAAHFARPGTSHSIVFIARMRENSV